MGLHPTKQPKKSPDGFKSLLVKSSWYGSDPNWGRIVDAAGYAKAGINFEKVSMFYDQVPVLRSGEPIESNKAQWKEIVTQLLFQSS